MASDDASVFTFEEILQLLEGIEAGAGTQNELMEYAIRIGEIAEQAQGLPDTSFETLARFLVRPSHTFTHLF